MTKTGKMLGTWDGPNWSGTWNGTAIFDNDGILKAYGDFEGQNKAVRGNWRGKGEWEKKKGHIVEWKAKGELKWTRGGSTTSAVVPLLISLAGVIVGVAGLLTGVLGRVGTLFIFIIVVLLVLVRPKGTWKAGGHLTDNQGDCIIEGIGNWRSGFAVFGKMIFNITGGRITMGRENSNDK